MNLLIKFYEIQPNFLPLGFAITPSFSFIWSRALYLLLFIFHIIFLFNLPSTSIYGIQYLTAHLLWNERAFWSAGDGRGDINKKLDLKDMRGIFEKVQLWRIGCNFLSFWASTFVLSIVSYITLRQLKYTNQTKTTIFFLPFSEETVSRPNSSSFWDNLSSSLCRTVNTFSFKNIHQLFLEILLLNSQKYYFSRKECVVIELSFAWRGSKFCMQESQVLMIL